MRARQIDRLNEAKKVDRYRELIQTSKSESRSTETSKAETSKSETNTGETSKSETSSPGSNFHDSPRISINGRTCLDLSSNDYLGLAGSARLIAAATRAMQEEGFGGRSSRLISGNNIYYERLENSLSEFKGRDSSLVFSSGYLANIGVIATLARRGDTIFCDHNAHASIIDACRLSGAKLIRYPHNDINALSDMLAAKRSTQNDLIVTEGLFSMDGDVGNLPAILDIAEAHDAVLIVDDAHGTGTLGASGAGAFEHFGLSAEQKRDPRLIEIGTLSKALGSLGGFALFSDGMITNSAEMLEKNTRLGLKEYFVNFSRALTYTTALPPAVLAASLEALRIIQDEPERRLRLAANASRMREGLRSAGFTLVGDELKAEQKAEQKAGGDPLRSDSVLRDRVMSDRAPKDQALYPETSPIIPVLVGSDENCILFAKKLLDRGIFIPGIRPPTVAPGKSRLRISVTALLEDSDIDMACEVLATAGRELSIVGGKQ